MLMGMLKSKGKSDGLGVGGLAPAMERAVGQAYNVPGAREVLAGTVDSILRKLKVISGG